MYLLNLGTISKYFLASYNGDIRLGLCLLTQLLVPGIAIFLHTLRFKKVLPPKLTFSVYLLQIYG